MNYAKQRYMKERPSLEDIKAHLEEGGMDVTVFKEEIKGYPFE